METGRDYRCNKEFLNKCIIITVGVSSPAEDKEVSVC